MLLWNGSKKKVFLDGGESVVRMHIIADAAMRWLARGMEWNGWVEIRESGWMSIVLSF